ncbi:MAG: TRAP transporter substrate-binding protein DctP, partial [Gammaproteobacteria bacterium]
MLKPSLKLFAFACLALAFGAGVQAKTLKIATLAPAGTSWMQEMQAGAELILERTEGRVKLKFYPGGVMGNDQSVHRKIRIGQLHGGAFTPTGLAGVDSSIQVLSLPMLFRNLDEVDYVRERMDPVLKQEMSDSGFVILGITEGGFARILSRQPMQDLESLRRGKVWIPEGDRISQVVFEALGITPVSLPIGDVFTGLQTGLIDTVAVNPTSAIAFQWHTSTEYMTEVPITYLIGILAVSKKAFEELSGDDRAIVVEEMGRVFARMDVSSRSENEAALEALASQGISFVPAKPGEAERWRKIADGAIDEMIAEGLIDGEIVGRV